MKLGSKGETGTFDSIQDALWSNTRDSLRHAIDHFSELSGSCAAREHHVKWAILSVHHAAECFCHMKVAAARKAMGDETGAIFQNKKGKTWYPSLRETLAEIGPLTGASARLVCLFSVLAETRDAIMHRALPDELDSSVAAMSALGMLRLLPAWVGKTSAEVASKFRPPEANVFEGVSAERVEEYCKFAEHLLAEEHPYEELPRCPLCETASVMSRRCEVCFEDMDSIQCPNSGESVYYPYWYSRAGHEKVECPHCDELHPLR